MISKENRNPSVAAKSVAMKKPESFFAEQPPRKIEMAPAHLHQLTRRDVLLFGAGALAVLAGGGFVLHKLRSGAWACVETWTSLGKSGF